MLFVKGDEKEVYEFRNSPLNNEHLKHSSLLSFHHKRTEYSVGDCFVSDNESECIYQITTLFYKTTHTFHPTLHMRCATFMKYSVFYVRNSHLRRINGPNTRYEYIQLQDTQELTPDQIEEKAFISRPNDWHKDKRNSYFCRFFYNGNDLVPYTPFMAKFCDPFVENGTIFFIY